MLSEYVFIRLNAVARLSRNFIFIVIDTASHGTHSQMVSNQLLFLNRIIYCCNMTTKTKFKAD